MQLLQGSHKVGEKIQQFSRRLFQSHNYTFPEVTATKSIHNNDLHISRVIPHQLLVMWLTRACRPILLKSTVFMHQIHLAAYGLLDTDCTQTAKSVLPEATQNTLRIPWVFHVQRNPWVFCVVQVYGYGALLHCAWCVSARWTDCADWDIHHTHTSYMPCQQFLHGTHGDELLLLVHPFNGLLSRTTWLSRHQKGKPFWILLEQELMWWQWHQLDHMQSSLQTDNHASTSPLSFLQARSLPAAQPTASKQWRL